MHIIDLVQRSPEWQAWRAGGVTASEAAVILGRSPYQTPWRLWAEKTGLCAPADLSDNPFVQRGLQYEDTARQGFEIRHQTWLLPVCAESARHPELRCSFDGLTDTGEPVELKVPAVKTWETLQREGEASLAFQLYWIQVQFQLFIAEADRGWLVFDPVQTGRVALEFVIARDAAFIAQELVPACLAFLDRFRVLPVGYLEPEVELGVLAGAVPSLPPEVGEKLIAVANEVRRLFVGEGESTAQLTITLSTRTLVRWARLALTFRGAPQPIRFALEQALTARADPDQREAIHRVAADVMGDLWTGSPAA